ncbi:TonB-dependent receptor [Thiorhodococcus drewsii AZ1]|uniref:TonB-dependent receptor n=1 Tax=Thiorhodococcus drewsii AZ1 TaxID=765913 RepID=G2E6Y0_9GAMM|nr:TonB-dependent receptor [Thiorhodococcus drewsii]EGV28142.1 TonB-dependent receptor [Thiorhodococcus drewsii AZ1]
MKTQFLFSTLGLLATPVLADTSGQALFGSEQTVSIATGRTHPIRTAPAVATVISPQDIRDGGFRSVVEALRLVPGFHLGLNSDYGPNLTVRGFTGLGAGNLLVLLDGLPQTDGLLGNPLAVLGTVPLDAIERIEVTRGPGSSVFGADAFSGVINVITRQQVEQNRITMGAGSWRSREGRLLTGMTQDTATLVLSAEARSGDGPAPILDGDRLSLIDDQLGTGFSLAPSRLDTGFRTLGLLLNARLGRTRAMARLSRMQSELGAGMLGVIDPTGTRRVQTAEGRLDHRVTFSDRLDLTLRLDAAQTRLWLNDITWFPDTGIFAQAVRFDAGAEQETWRLRADLRYALDSRHFITAGLGYERVRSRIDAMDLTGLNTRDLAFLRLLSLGFGGTGDGSGVSLRDVAQTLLHATQASDSQERRRLLSAYVQDEWLIAPKWSLTWGVRLDAYSDLGTQFSPRAVLVWTPLPEWTLKLLYGEGFRAPTQLEAQGGLLPVYRANPALEPERLRTLELGLSYQPHPRLDLGLNLFRHETRDQIRLQDRGLYAEPENVGRQVGQGAEFEWRWRLTRHLSARGWYAYQFNTDETTGKDAGFSPHHRLYGSLQYQLGRTFFNLQGLYVGDRARVAEDSRDEAPEYGQLDLLVRQDLNKQISVQLDIRNLLNGHLYEASPGTALPQDLKLGERSYMASLEVRF